MNGITITGAGAEFFLPEWNNGEWKLKLIKRPPASLRTINYSLVEELDGLTRTSNQSATTSDPEAPAPNPLPTNTTPPSISGNQTQGSTLTRTAGTWSNAQSVTGQWLRAGSPIAGATGATYTTQTADIGQTITYRETATNSANQTASATSNGIQVTSASGVIRRALTAHPARRLTLPTIQSDAVVAEGLPLGTAVMPGALDPDEAISFAVLFDNRLRASEQIGRILRIQLSEGAVALGVTIDTTRAPFVDSEDGQAVEFRLFVDEATRNYVTFQGNGRTFSIDLLIETAGDDPERHNATIQMRARTK